MKSYQQSPSLKSKKRESAIKGKENKPVACKPVACSKGLFACERARGRVGIRKRLIQAAVEDALRIFELLIPASRVSEPVKRMVK